MLEKGEFCSCIEIANSIKYLSRYLNEISKIESLNYANKEVLKEILNYKFSEYAALGIKKFKPELILN